MLGAPWDISDNCPESGATLMATVGRPRGLSQCTKEALIQQYNNNTNKDVCWKKTLKADASSNWSLPATYFQRENYCSTRDPRRVFKCPEGNQYYVANATKCSIGCCKYNTTEAGGFTYPVPDGTPCGNENICVAAVCSEFSKEDSD
ncbi:unnamed protein product [Ixodes pacificus]